MNSFFKNSVKNLYQDANGNIVERVSFEPIPFDGRGRPRLQEIREKGPFDINRMNQIINIAGKPKVITSESVVVTPAPIPVTSTPTVVTPTPVSVTSTPITTPPITTSNKSDTKNEIFTTENILIGAGVLFVIYLMKSKKK
ncbi:hypothetical protein [Capnocytophaga canimorsus]|uniref:hypothetical protein n=1 Tax=Capnocytophaga canimorsus TaxID=28188 RepID=UPI0037D6128F